MDSWHTCDTIHCLGGWAIALTPGGKAFEDKTSQYLAAALLVPELKHWFYDTAEKALQETEKYLPEGYKV